MFFVVLSLFLPQCYTEVKQDALGETLDWFCRSDTGAYFKKCVSNHWDWLNYDQFMCVEKKRTTRRMFSCIKNKKRNCETLTLGQIWARIWFDWNAHLPQKELGSLAPGEVCMSLKYENTTCSEATCPPWDGTRAPLISLNNISSITPPPFFLRGIWPLEITGIILVCRSFIYALPAWMSSTQVQEILPQCTPCPHASRSTTPPRLFGIGERVSPGCLAFDLFSGNSLLCEARRVTSWATGFSGASNATLIGSVCHVSAVWMKYN